MTEVRWTPQATDDLQAIYDFIGRDSPHYAQVIVEDLLAGIDRLERFPLTADTSQSVHARIFENLSNHHTGLSIELAK